MRKRHWTWIVLALLVLAAPAWAQAEAPAHAGEAAEEAGLLSIDTATVIIAILTFVILVVILKKLAWGPILTGLQERESTIRTAIDDAQKANAEARALVQEYQDRLATAHDEARAINEEARKNAEVVRHQIQEDARKESEATLTRALKEIELAKQTAMDQLLRDTTAIATEAASRIVRRTLTPEDNAKIVDEVVQDFVDSRRGESA